MIYRFGDYVLDTSRFELRRGSVACPVEPQVFEILRFLLEHRDRMVSREELTDAIWHDRFVSDTTVSSRIKQARKAIGDNGKTQSSIRTIHGRGFRFVAQVIEEELSDSLPSGVEMAEGPSRSEVLQETKDPALIERESALKKLRHVLDAHVRQGTGQIVLIAGEAGIGKSSVIRSFCRGLDHVELWIGSCDALTTPRALGPLHDIARQAGGEMKDALASASDWHVVLAALLSRLGEARTPVVIVVEDVHWADEATIDLLVSLARRITDLSAMVIASYRSDEVVHAHPLRRFLGNLTSAWAHRVDLEPLSTAAVGELAQVDERDAERLHEMTGGNAFFLTEVLANPTGDLPPTIRDAVLGRIGGLSAEAREIVELASIAPGELPLATLMALRPEKIDAIEEALSVGTILSDSESLRFRHELARVSVYESMPPIKSLLLHRQLLRHLLSTSESDLDLAAILHHARALRDMEIIRDYAPKAARDASSAGAHLQALAHYECALEHESAFSKEQLAAILEGISFEIYLTGDTDSAISFRERALTLRRELEQKPEAGSDLRWLSRLHWFAGRNEDARRYAAQAVAVLEELPASRELAMAYSNRAQLAMLESRLEGVLRWGERAINLATELGDREVLAHALTNVGLARLIAGEEEGKQILLDALEICLEDNMQEHAVRAITGLGTVLVARKVYPEGVGYLEQGIEFCSNHDLDSWSPYLEAYLARAELETGNWSSAAARAASVLERERIPAITRIAALVPLGLLKVRLGDDEGRALLRDALGLAQRTGELQRLAPAVSALTEVEWLDGSFGESKKLLSGAVNLAMKRNRIVEREQLSYWLWKAGHGTTLECVTPYGLQVAGRWKEAAERWRIIGCPWEQAMALGEGDAPAVEESIRMMREMGSSRGAEAIARDASRRGK